MANKPQTKPNLHEEINYYPPVVTVLGHVDHGKTTLLDAIRKTNIAAKEHGSITQKIGTSSIEIDQQGKKRKITFIDTPGHEAFSKMRGRGASVSDICLLIVSSVEGVKPQTKESINILKETKMPFIVVLTKSDDPNKNPDKVKGELVKEEVMLEGYGGDVPVIEVSAKTGQNIKELLELILLVMELKVEKKTFGDFEGVVVESFLDKHSGPKATVVVKNGKISIKDEIFCEGIYGKVKSMIDDKGKNLNSATIGDAVEILGFEKTPMVGAVVRKNSNKITKPEVQVSGQKELSFSLDQEKDDTLNLFLIANSEGSLEALKHAMPEKAKIIFSKSGEIAPADILFAKSTNSIILSFGLKIKPEIMQLSNAEKVIVRNYNLIYEMLDDVKDVLEGKRLGLIEEVFGKAKILASFPFEKQQVLGIAVTEGRVAKGDKVRLMRGEEVIGETSVSSLRQGKENVSKVEATGEAGILLARSLDFTIGDMLIFHG